MAVVLHLIPANDWAALGRDDSVTNTSLSTEGFIHCTDEPHVLLQVANAFYATHDGDFLVLYIDTALLDSPCVWEAPSHPASPDAPPPAVTLFPHVYGPINRSAVIRFERVTRNSAGGFTGFVTR